LENAGLSPEEAFGFQETFQSWVTPPQLKEPTVFLSILEIEILSKGMGACKGVL